jgi:signal transduction histidine kinase
MRARLRALLALVTPSWVVLFYAALLLLSGWGYAALRVRADREETLTASRARLSSVAGALETGLVAMLNDGVGAAQAGANEVDALGGLNSATDAQLVGTLQKMLTGGQYVRSLFVAGPHRYARAGHSGGFEAARVLPDWLEAIEESTASSVWIGRPMPDPDQPERFVVPIARRIAYRSGEFIWAGGWFDFAAIDALGGRTDGTVGFAGIVRLDGIVLISLRFPNGREIAPGTDISDSPLFTLGARNPAGGVVEGYAPNLGITIIGAYLWTRNYPMALFTAEPLDVALAPWRERRFTTLLITGASSVLLALMTALLTRSLSARKRQQESAAARSERLRLQSSALLQIASRKAPGMRDPAPLLCTVCADAAEVLVADRVSIWLLDEETHVLHPAGQYERTPVPPREWTGLVTGRIQHCLERLRTAPAVATGSASDDPAFAELLDVDIPIRHDAAIIIAAIRGTANLMGLIMIGQRDRRSWHEDEVAFASGVADQVARMVLHTQREQLLEELRVLAGELMRSEDEERRRIGRDLHDSTGQTLAVLELDLEVLLKNPAGFEPRQIAQLRACVNLAHQCTTEIRTASYLLHPPLLDELGLLSALRWLADGMRERSKIAVRLELPASMRRLRPEAELALFRVAQEALTNVHRHTDSPWVAIRLKESTRFVQLEIEDAGSGLSQGRHPGAPALSNAVGVGLAGMRARVRQIGGTFSIRSGVTGTCIRARLSVSSVEPLEQVTS